MNNTLWNFPRPKINKMLNGTPKNAYINLEQNELKKSEKTRPRCAQGAKTLPKGGSLLV